MRFNDFRSALGRGTLRRLVKDILCNNEIRLNFRLFLDCVNQLDTKTSTIPDKTYADLIWKACPNDRYEREFLFESIAHECFFSEFCYNHIDEMDNYRERKHSISPEEFFRSILPVLFKVDINHPDAKHKPASSSAYYRLIDLMAKSFSETTTDDPQELRKWRDHIIHVLMTYIKDPDVTRVLMMGYTILATADIRNFLDLWFRTAIPEMVPEGTKPIEIPVISFAKIYPGDELSSVFKKTQLSEILALFEDASSDLKKLLGVETLLKKYAIKMHYSIFFEGPDDIEDSDHHMSFKDFHTLLVKAHPTYETDFQNNAIKNLKSESVTRRYLSGETKHARKGGAFDAYLNYLVDSHTEVTAFNIIRGLLEREDYVAAILLSHIYQANLKDIRVFYDHLLRRVDVFKKDNDEINRLDLARYYEQTEIPLYETIYQIIRYRDQSFQEPLFNDERDEYLTAETFKELSLLLADYFSHPRVFFSSQIYNIAYWLGDIFDKQMLGHLCEEYKYLPELTIAVYLNTATPSETPTYQQIRHYNGLGYSLALTGDPNYLPSGFRILRTARQYFLKLPMSSRRCTEGRHLEALLYSNMATYFLRDSFIRDNDGSRRMCLRTALYYDLRAHVIRKGLGKGYEPFIALSYTNCGTSLYYSGKYLMETSPKKPESAKKFFMQSLKKNLHCVVLYLALGDRSDQIIRAAKKVFGTATALKDCSPGFCTPANLGYKDNPEKLIDDFKRCRDILKNYDRHAIYVGKDEIRNAEIFCEELPELLTRS